MFQVRTTTLITLIYLLQEDYLKMSGRGAFFFRILQTLNDESEEMRSLVTFYFQQRLLKRKPKTMYSHFVEALFHFNEYEDHQRFNKFVVTEREKELFSIKGPEHRGERMVLYKFMLRHMEDADRLGTMHKISEDVLKGVVNGQVSLDDKSFGLLQDSLSCLASEEIKLSTLNANKADEDDEAGAAADGKLLEEEMRNQAVIRAVHKSIVTQAVKKSMVEHIIPNIIDFKHALEVARSPLLSDLMTSLRELMKDFKNEVIHLLPQLLPVPVLIFGIFFSTHLGERPVGQRPPARHGDRVRPQKVGGGAEEGGGGNKERGRRLQRPYVRLFLHVQYSSVYLLNPACFPVRS